MSEKQVREFKLTTYALKNKNTIFLIILVIVIFGGLSYSTLPKELFPEVKFPTILVQTTYFGNPPEDIENLVTRPLEKELKTVKGVKDLKSISVQDASMIFVEFSFDKDIQEAKTQVKDAVDKVKGEGKLPTDLTRDPTVFEIDLSEVPVININISGDFSLDELKSYADYLQDEIETIYEISEVNIKGITEREIQINVDPYALDYNQVSFYNVENAIRSENMNMSGGEIKMGGTRRAIRMIGEFKSLDQIRNLVVKNENAKIVYLKDVAEVVDSYEEAKSFARLDNKPVVSLEVVKKSGENLLNAIDQTFAIVANAKKENIIPDELRIDYTNDQSKQIRNQLNNLENSIYIGVIFVVMVLFFFLGIRNALIVGAAIPMSMLLSFVVLGIMGATINMMVLFSLVLALGMLVDNAIVVVENIYRFVDQGYTIQRAAWQAVGEIAMPIISSTATTLAAFFPLIFWDSLMGEFMKFLPITLIIVLTSSLVVALIITPVIGSIFIKPTQSSGKLKKKKLYRIAFICLIISLPFYFGKVFGFANLLALAGVIIIIHVLVMHRLSIWFQNSFLPRLENLYLRSIRFTLKGKRPGMFFLSTFVILFFAIILYGGRNGGVLFFPDNEPQYINIFANFPIGTDVIVTNDKMKAIEKDVFKFIEPYDTIVESVLTTIGKGVKRESEWFSTANTPNKGMMTIKFVDFEDRGNMKTSEILKELSKKLHNKYPGVEMFLEKNSNGPPAGAKINLEVSGRELQTLISLTDSITDKIHNAGIEGIEGLKLDVDFNSPELQVVIDRDKARRFGLSTAQISSNIRTALFGSEVSDFKVGEDEYPIQIRFKEDYRHNITSLLNQTITFRNQSNGRIVQIPISSVADFKYTSSYDKINRKNLKRVITIFSNVVEGYNATKINQDIAAVLEDMEMPNGYKFEFTGEQQEQEESMAFLGQALLISIFLIMIILVSQFNSFVKPFIIIASVLFSTIGVFGGLATFKMSFVVIMTGVGIVSLAGVVVNNAIVLIDYIDYLKLNRKKELGLDENEVLTVSDIKLCIINGGKTRLRPVLLTAITTILGLLPMAVGLNINFATMFTRFDPQFYFGGDNAAFWGPMSWTVIFGLTFATFLTLFIVPSMYLIANIVKLKTQGKLVR